MWTMASGFRSGGGNSFALDQSAWFHAHRILVGPPGRVHGERQQEDEHEIFQ